MEREVSHSLVRRKCKFFQGVISCDRRFGKAVQVTVSPVSCPVLCFGLKGRCVLQVWRDKELQLCTSNKRFDLNELGFYPLEPELIWHSLLPESCEGSWSGGWGRNSHLTPSCAGWKGGLQQQHQQQRESLAHSSWPLIHEQNLGLKMLPFPSVICLK